MEGRALSRSKIDAKFVRTIKENYVPVAVNYMYHGQPKDSPFAPFVNQNNLGNILTANGKKVPSSDSIYNGLVQFKKLPLGDRKPAVLVEVKEGAPATLPDKGLVVKTYTRALGRSPKGEFVSPRHWKIGTGTSYKMPAEPMPDFLWLKEAEWKALVPANPEVGKTVPVPAAIFNRVCWFHIKDEIVSFGMQAGIVGYNGSPKSPPGKMTLTVEEATTDSIRMRLQGSAHLKAGHECDIQFAGVLEYDRQKKVFTRFDMVALGELKAMPSPKDRFTIRPILPADHTVWMAVAFDLGRADTPIERLPPQAMRFWREKYFTNGK